MAMEYEEMDVDDIGDNFEVVDWCSFSEQQITLIVQLANIYNQIDYVKALRSQLEFQVKPVILEKFPTVYDFSVHHLKIRKMLATGLSDFEKAELNQKYDHQTSRQKTIKDKLKRWMNRLQVMVYGEDAVESAKAKGMKNLGKKKANAVSAEVTEAELSDSSKQDSIASKSKEISIKSSKTPKSLVVQKTGYNVLEEINEDCNKFIAKMKENYNIDVVIHCNGKLFDELVVDDLLYSIS